MLLRTPCTCPEDGAPCPGCLAHDRAAKSRQHIAPQPARATALPEGLSPLEVLYRSYKAAGIGTPNGPWTRDACLQLGIAWFRQYGRLPVNNECRSGYGLPAHDAMVRHFGSYYGYLQALAQAVGTTVPPLRKPGYRPARRRVTP